jgi:hypothetical protein
VSLRGTTVRASAFASEPFNYRCIVAVGSLKEKLMFVQSPRSIVGFTFATSTAINHVSHR